MTITLYIIGYILCGIAASFIRHVLITKRQHDTTLKEVIGMCMVGPAAFTAVVSVAAYQPEVWQWLDKPVFRKREG